MKPTTLLLLLSLSVAVHSRLISGTVNLTKDTTGINFVNDTIQLVTNDTCKYPDCKRVYYCGDTSAPDFYFTPLRLGITSRPTNFSFEVGSINPFYLRTGRSLKDVTFITDKNKVFPFDTIYYAIKTCFLPYDYFLYWPDYGYQKLFIAGKTKTNLFFLLEVDSYWKVTKFQQYTGLTEYETIGLHAKWWLQTNGEPDFNELVQTTNSNTVSSEQIRSGNKKPILLENMYTIRGQRIISGKNKHAGHQVVISNGNTYVLTEQFKVKH